MTSFVKLFIMNRMIKLNNNCKDTSVLFPVEHMMIKDKNNPRIKAAHEAQDIITRLSMIGIKKYMDKQYDDKSEVISILFDKLVDHKRAHSCCTIYNEDYFASKT